MKTQKLFAFIRVHSRLAFCLLQFAFCLGFPSLSPESSHSAKRKLERIGEEKLRPGESVVLTQDEINSYLRYDYASEMPAGVTDPNLRLEPDRVTGTATVDFLEWQVQKGASPGFLLRWLLQGKRRVEVVGRWTSADGYGRADIESVTIGAVPVSGGAVKFLIDNLVRPRYPGAIVGEWVPLGYHLKQVRIERGRAVVVGM